MLKATIALGLATAILAGCSPGPKKVDTEEAKQAILAKEDAWNKAYANRNGDQLTAFYADDAAVAAPGEQLVRGKDSIRETMAAMAKDPNMKLSFRANNAQVAKSGDLAYTRGQFVMTATNPETNQPQTTNGYYLTVWKRVEGGEWKAVEDFITPGETPRVAERATMIQGI